MSPRFRSALFLICLSAFGMTAVAATEPKEDNCRKAIEEGLNVLRQPPAKSTERSEKSRQRLLSTMQRLVDTNRQQGKTECQTWG